MAGRISNSFSLVRASARVLAADRELLVFPLISGAAALLVSASFFVPAWWLGALDAWSEGGIGVVGYVFTFLFYLVQYTVVFFFNTALVGAALIRLEGGDPTVRDGLQIAFDRLDAILGYAAIAATVGMVLRAVSERSGWVGRIVAGIVGVGWTLSTYLVVPVLVTRDVGPVDAIKESAAVFRSTWGEQVVGQFGMGLAVFLMAVSFTLFAVPLLVLAAATPATLVLAIVAVVSGYVLLGLVGSALKGIYAAALYRYAVTGEAAYGFDQGLLAQAFVPRR